MIEIIIVCLLQLFTILSYCQLSEEYVQKAEVAISEINGWAPTLNGSILPYDCVKYGCDAVFFNGITCSTGKYPKFCESVKETQNEEGRFYRNIWHMDQKKDSFSRDMALGVLMSLTETKDKESFVKWMGYISEHKTMCVDEVYNPNCDISPTLYCGMKYTAENLGVEYSLPNYTVVMPPLSKKHVDEICENIGEALDLEAIIIPDCSSCELVALQVLVFRNYGKFNMTRFRTTNAELYKRHTYSMLFEYLAEGISDQLVENILSLIPKIKKKYAHCWIWAHDYREEADNCLKRSLGWDIVFLLTDILNHNVIN